MLGHSLESYNVCGASTKTLQVISSEFWVRQAAVLEATSGVLGEVDEPEHGKWVVVLLSM